MKLLLNPHCIDAGDIVSEMLSDGDTATLWENRPPGICCDRAYYRNHGIRREYAIRPDGIVYGLKTGWLVNSPIPAPNDLLEAESIAAVEAAFPDHPRQVAR